MSTPSPAFGDSIGRYRLIGELARGGMGIVYLAAAHGPAGFSKLVALKELRPDLVQDAEFLTMFLDEARMAARLNHPNIVQTNDVGEENGRHFLTMEYLDGRSFHQILKRFASRNGFPLPMSVAILRDALSALDYAHELADFDGSQLGFVHRDVSPHNVFVTFDGHAKVIDFGIAKARDSSLQTKTGVLKGRASYMAPEQLTHHADRRTDIFSVGAVLFELVTGKRLWHGMNDLEILVRLTRGDIPSVQPAAGDVPAALTEICQRALKAKPDERYATAAEMRDALDDYLWSSGGAPKPREVSLLLTTEYEAERQRSRAILDAALFRLQNGAGGRLETLHTGDAGHTGTGTRGSGGSSVNRAVPVEVIAAQEKTVPNDPRARAAGSSRDELHFGVLTPAPPVRGLQLPEFLVQHRRMVAAALGSVVAALITAFALHRTTAPPIAPTAVAVPVAALDPPAENSTTQVRPLPAPAAQPAPSLPAPAMPEMIMFSVSVAPSYAQVLIDGEPMPSNPFFGRFPKSPSVHRVRAVASGFQPKERLVSFSENVMIDLNLVARPSAHETPPSRREPAPPPRRIEAVAVHAVAPPPTQPAPVAAPPPPPARSSAPADIVPRTGSEPQRRRSIDSSNPYGEER
jgi:serine/threonine-protein kinase